MLEMNLEGKGKESLVTVLFSLIRTRPIASDPLPLKGFQAAGYRSCRPLELQPLVASLLRCSRSARCSEASLPRARRSR